MVGSHWGITLSTKLSSTGHISQVVSPFIKPLLGKKLTTLTSHPLSSFPSIEWVSDQCFKSQMTLFRSYHDWNKVYQAQWFGLRTMSCLYVLTCMYWVRLVLVRLSTSLHSATPLKHHVTGRQWCPNPDHYPDTESTSRSLTPLCWALSRAAEPQIFRYFVWCGRGSNHQSPACQANIQPLHYSAVSVSNHVILG